MSDRSAFKPAAPSSGGVPASAVGNAAFQAEASPRVARLIRTIESEIVPRLLVSLSGSLTTVRREHRDCAVELAEFVSASRQLAAADDLAQLRDGLDRLQAMIQQVR